MERDGQPPRHIADIGMRLIVGAETYEEIGAIMDVVDRAVTHALGEKRLRENAAFDFTHFNTRPCKSAQLEQRYDRMMYEREARGGVSSQAVPLPDYSEQPVDPHPVHHSRELG